ncbi:MAG: hypothetical protein IE884_03765 [Sulfuricurvum sp.]|nr:hypothetical protein [Sulfuricurvum sp.]
MKFWLLSFGLVSYAMSASFNVEVRFEGEGLSTLRTLSQAFNTIGYKLEVESFSCANDQGELEAKAIGNRVFNPTILAENLKDQGVGIAHVRYEGEKLTLTFHSQNILWNAPLLGADEGVELKKTSAPQWFRVEEGQTIRIKPPYTGKWYPDIAVLDAQMGVLSSYRSREFKEEFQFELPLGARYLKVSNAQGMKVLKDGMWIESMSLER